MSGPPSAKAASCSEYASSWTTAYTKANSGFGNGGGYASHVDTAGVIYVASYTVPISTKVATDAAILESTNAGASWTAHALPVTTVGVSQILGDSSGNIYVIAWDESSLYGPVTYVFRGKAGGAFTTIDVVSNTLPG